MAEHSTSPSRREFYKSAAAAALAPLAATPASAQEKGNPLQQVADNLFAITKIKYGAHLTEEQLAQVKQSIQRDVYGAELLKKMPLQNSDEPSFVFRADLP